MAEQETKELCLYYKGDQVSESRYADYAQQIMQNMASGKLTTTKLRKIYANITNLSSKITDQQEFQKSKADLQYLKVKMAYEAGREDAVKNFLNETHLMDMLSGIETYEQFNLYCHYAESLVAYFKYYGGKDN